MSRLRMGGFLFLLALAAIFGVDLLHRQKAQAAPAVPVHDHAAMTSGGPVVTMTLNRMQWPVVYPEGPCQQPQGAPYFDTVSGSTILEGNVTVSWGVNSEGVSYVSVIGGDAKICVKAANNNSGQIWLYTGDTYVLPWLNDGNQHPAISHLVIYSWYPIMAGCRYLLTATQAGWFINHRVDPFWLKVRDLDNNVNIMNQRLPGHLRGSRTYALNFVNPPASGTNLRLTLTLDSGRSFIINRPMP